MNKCLKLVVLLLVISVSFQIRSFALDVKIVICGVCKNVEANLMKTIESIEELGNNFMDYRVFIYENNSSDNTKIILKNWSKKNSKVSVSCEDFSEEELKSFSISKTFNLQPCRMELIARARNQVLLQGMSPEYNDYEYILMIDMDSPRKWDIQGILSSFNISIEWDAILANGIDSNGYMYDYYAWRDLYKIPLGPELLGDVFWNNIAKEKLKFERNRSLIPVYSAFGGLGIYKRTSIIKCTYAALPCSELELLLNDIIHRKPIKSKYIRYYLKKTNPLKINFINNSGYDKPVVCEHVIFHAKMAANGFNKIFVNPNMVFYY